MSKIKIIQKIKRIIIALYMLSSKKKKKNK